ELDVNGRRGLRSHVLHRTPHVAVSDPPQRRARARTTSTTRSPPESPPLARRIARTAAWAGTIAAGRILINSSVHRRLAYVENAGDQITANTPGSSRGGSA